MDFDAKIQELESLLATHLGWDPEKTWNVTGQTYPRLADAQLISSLAAAAAAISLKA